MPRAPVQRATARPLRHQLLSAVRTATVRQSSGGRGDPRLYALNENYEKRAAAAGATEFVPSDGGFLVFPTSVQLYNHEDNLS